MTLMVEGEGKGSARSPTPIFGIFEGGGAKGIAHLGAFAACEQNGFYFVGVAGASAGAIIATLIAAGFGADDLYDPGRPSEHILARYNETPLSLLGEEAWVQGRAFVERAMTAAASRGLKGRWRARWWLIWRARALMRMVGRLGYLSTERAREVLNTALRDQLGALRERNAVTEEVPERITFKDLDPGLLPEVRPLKIIAANVDSQELVIFDRERTPNLEVGLAVAASMAIPGLFAPVTIRADDGSTSRYMDGGAVSNLPVWAFRDEKLAFERANPQLGPVQTVGFTLKPKTPADPSTPSRPEWLSYLEACVATALSGSQSVIAEFLDDLRLVPLHTELTTLDFDAGPERMLEAYRDGLRCADRDIAHYLVDQPRLIRSELELFQEAVRGALPRSVPASQRRRLRLRSCIVEQVRPKVFRVTHALGMEQDADDRLTLDARGRASPRAYLDREAQFLRVWDADASPPKLDYMTKYERALANKAVRGIIATPIFADLDAWSEPQPRNRPEPVGVVAFDGTDDQVLEAAFADPNFMRVLRTQSTLLYPALTTEPSRG